MPRSDPTLSGPRAGWSGEHGIGLLKRDFLAAGLDPNALALMAHIKTALDPDNRLNPGKVTVD